MSHTKEMILFALFFALGMGAGYFFASSFKALVLSLILVVFFSALLLGASSAMVKSSEKAFMIGIVWCGSALAGGILCGRALHAGLRHMELMESLL